MTRRPCPHLLIALVALVVALLIAVAMAKGQTAQQPLVGALIYAKQPGIRTVGRCSGNVYCFGSFDASTWALIFDPTDKPTRYRWATHNIGPVFGPETVRLEAMQDALDHGCGALASLGLPPGYVMQPWDRNDAMMLSGGGYRSWYEANVLPCDVTAQPVPTQQPSPPPPVVTPTPPAPQPTPQPTAAPTSCPVCPLAEQHVAEKMPAEVAATLRAGVNSLGKRWTGDKARALAWIAAHRLVYVPAERSTGNTEERP